MIFAYHALFPSHFAPPFPRFDKAQPNLLYTNSTPTMEHTVSETKGGRLIVSWAILTAVTAAIAVLGLTGWEDWRASVEAPGLFAGLGVLCTALGFALPAWFLVASLIHRRWAIVRYLAAWIFAAFLAAVGLAFYAAPVYPLWGFLLSTAVAAAILIALHPFRRR